MPLRALEQLRCDLTRITDNSTCGYDAVIAELEHQLKWWKKAMRDEIRARKAEERSH